MTPTAAYRTEHPKHLAFSLPIFPVPLSACFVNVARNGRADSARYAAWKSTTDAFLAKNLAGWLGHPWKATFSGQVAVAITLEQPDRRQRDLDNSLKGIADCLQRNHILENDSQIVDLHIRWTRKGEDMELPVYITISEVVLP